MSHESLKHIQFYGQLTNLFSQCMVLSSILGNFIHGSEHISIVNKHKESESEQILIVSCRLYWVIKSDLKPAY